MAEVFLLRTKRKSRGGIWRLFESADDGLLCQGVCLGREMVCGRKTGEDGHNRYSELEECPNSNVDL